MKMSCSKSCASTAKGTATGGRHTGRGEEIGAFREPVQVEFVG
jgi:hypothetical protein